MSGVPPALNVPIFKALSSRMFRVATSLFFRCFPIRVFAMAINKFASAPKAR